MLTLVKLMCENEGMTIIMSLTSDLCLSDPDYGENISERRFD